VRATGKDHLKLRLSQPRIRIDLSKAEAGTVVQRLLVPGDVVAPSGITMEVVGVIEPPMLNMEVDELLERELRVSPALNGTPAPGYALGGAPETDPDVVRARGPRSLLAGVDFVRTLPVDLESLAVSTEVRVPLVPPAPAVSLSESEARVRLTIELLNQRTFNDIPVQILYSRPVLGAAADPGRVSVTVAGPSGLLKHLTSSDIRARVDARNLLSGKYEQLVSVTLPAGQLTLVLVSPDHCTVSLQ
jgi:YbbR domain-containing protein